MKIIIDECLPKRITQFFPGDEVWTVLQIGLSGFKDKVLLSDLFHSKDELVEAVKNATSGNIIRISA